MAYGTLKKSHIALIFSNALYGLNFVFYGSIIGHYLTFEQLFTLRVLFTALFFMPFIISRSLYIVKAKNFWRIAFVAMLMIFGKQYFLLWGMGYITPIDSSIVFSFGPIITLIFAGVLQKSHFSILKIIALTMGVVGSLLLLFFNNTPQEGAT
ncbi:MAG: EamA family transporter, partial [Rikenellaceae bacterium]